MKTGEGCPFLRSILALPFFPVLNNNLSTSTTYRFLVLFCAMVSSIRILLSTPTFIIIELLNCPLLPVNARPSAYGANASWICAQRISSSFQPFLSVLRWIMMRPRFDRAIFHLLQTTATATWYSVDSECSHMRTPRCGFLIYLTSTTSVENTWLFVTTKDPMITSRRRSR